MAVDGMTGSPAPHIGPSLADRIALYTAIVAAIGWGLTLYAKAVVAQESLSRTSSEVRTLADKLQATSDAVIEIRTELRVMALALKDGR